MKVKVVPALRKRGLRRGCGAEPRVSETINSMERTADTMKTYLLRAPKTVEPQKPARAPRWIAALASRLKWGLHGQRTPARSTQSA